MKTIFFLFSAPCKEKKTLRRLLCGFKRPHYPLCICSRVQCMLQTVAFHLLVTELSADVTESVFRVYHLTAPPLKPWCCCLHNPLSQHTLCLTITVFLIKQAAVYVFTGRVWECKRNYERSLSQTSHLRPDLSWKGGGQLNKVDLKNKLKKW